MGSLNIITNPFDPSNGRLRKAVVEGVKIGSIIEEYQSEEFGIVCSVNGVICEDTELVVKADDRIFIMARIRTGGGGDDESGSKSVLRIVAMIAVIAIAAAITGGAALAFSSALAPGTMASTIWGGIASAAGMMLVNAVLPPPTPSLKPISNESFSDGNSYGWSGGTNQITEGLTAPVLYGKFMITPQVISQSREFIDNKDNLNLLFLISEGRCLATTPDIFINGQTLSDFTDVSPGYNRGTINQTSLGGGFDDIIYQKPVNVVLDPDESNAGTQTVATDGNAVERLAIGISFPGGVYRYSGGVYHYLDVSFKAEFRVAGSAGAWTDFSGMSTSIGYTVTERQQVRVGSKQVLQYPSDTGGTGGRRDVTVPIYEEQDVQVTRTIDYDENVFGFNSNTPDTIRAVFTHDTLLTAAQYEVRVTKVKHTKSLVGNDSNLNQLRWEFLEERIPEELQYPGRCTLALNSVAQEKIYGQSPVITVVADRGELELYAGEWGSSTAVTGRASSNPAWACYDLLTHPLYGAGIHPSKIVEQEFIDWAAHCDSESLVVGLYLDNNMSMYDALKIISQIGRGAIVQRGTKYGAIVDSPSDLVYLFGMGQIIEGTFGMSYVERESRANVIECTYYDEDFDYTRKLFSLRQDTGAGAEFDKIASINLIGVTNRLQATRHCQFLLRGNQHLVRIVEFQAEIEAIHCQVGDVIGVSHDVPQYGQSGRVMSSTNNTVTLDHTISLSDETYSVIIKHLDDSLETVAVSNTDDDFSTLTLTSGTWDQNPDYMASYSIGIVSHETKLFRVTAIQKSQDFQAKIVAMEYNPLIYDLDAVLPTYEPASGLPSVDNLQLTQSFARFADGSYRGTIDSTWNGYSTQWRVSVWNESRGNTYPEWTTTVSERRHSTVALPVNGGETYRVRVTGLDGKYEESTVIFAIDPPEAPINLRSRVLDNFVFLNWDQPASELPIDRYEIYEGIDLLEASLVDTVRGTSFSTYESVSGGHFYSVLAVNVAGHRGAQATIDVVTTGDSDYVAIGSLNVDGSGTISGMIWDGSVLIGPYLESNDTWDDVWQANYPVNYTTAKWEDWPADRGVTTFMSALGTSGATSGSYVQQWDLGSLLPSDIQVGMVLNQAHSIGALLSASATTDLEFSADNSEWFSRPNAVELTVNGFRYVKLTVTVTGNGDGAIQLAPVITLRGKQLTQTGKEDIDSLVTGTVIAFTVPFHDVQSIQITAKGTTAVSGAYDFNDVANPTGFTAYLYDENNDRVLGDFSYTVIGF